MERWGLLSIFRLVAISRLMHTSNKKICSTDRKFEIMATIYLRALYE